MRAMRVPRSGSMIFGMFLALMATMLLPIVFMAALAASAEAHPRALTETLKDLARPLVSAAAHLRSWIR
ncbi:MAG: hypothetical protein JWM53_2354 [bacterium]|nr:hypothetical protein [bacterium]